MVSDFHELYHRADFTVYDRFFWYVVSITVCFKKCFNFLHNVAIGSIDNSEVHCLIPICQCYFQTFPGDLFLVLFYCGWLNIYDMILLFDYF